MIYGEFRNNLIAQVKCGKKFVFVSEESKFIVMCY
jgi:hypothetical protein